MKCIDLICFLLELIGTIASSLLAKTYSPPLYWGFRLGGQAVALGKKASDAVDQELDELNK